MGKRIIFLSIILGFLLLSLPLHMVGAATGLTLYTPYTGISVTPGEAIDYSFEVLNDTSNVQQVSLQVENHPQDWSFDFTSGGWNIQELSIKPNGSERFSFTVEVPLEVQKANYTFLVTATSSSGLEDQLPVTVTVSEKGTFKTELTTEQSNLEGHADSTFSYELEIKNRTAQEQHYALTAEAPRGWSAIFQVDGKSVTSITAPSNASKNINVTLTPPEQVDAGKYKIPIIASSSSTQAQAALEAVITGSYSIKLATPTGKLSEEIIAGKKRNIQLEVTNTGTVPLHDITLKATQPVNWKVDFEPKKLHVIEPGKTETVAATITASDNAIAGDYVVTMEATTPEASSVAEFRMSVKTSMLWGWIGVLIIACVIGGIYLLMRKYGRR